LRSRLLGVVLLAAAAVGASCDSEDAGTDTAPECVEEDTRCAGDHDYEWCIDGEWVRRQYCVATCLEDLGCVACDPSANGGLACDGNNVVECRVGGRFGAVVEECPEDLECSDGECEVGCTAEGLDLIYVVDHDYRLLSFDPREIDDGGQPFQVVGDLACVPEHPNVPGWNAPGTPTPFSMTVDREGYAWVLYTSGEVFKVNIADASCEPTAFERLQPGTQSEWAVFGMGFSTDVPGGEAEHLFVSGGSPTAAPGGMFGVIDPETLAITTLGAVPADAEYTPEFTGNGKAELFGYFPGTTATIRQLDRSSGQQLGGLIDAGTVVGGARAWAFAYWGEKFYIFITDGTGNSQVVRSDRETGELDGVMRSNLPYVIVGAGVSTCVPTAAGD